MRRLSRPPFVWLRVFWLRHFFQRLRGCKRWLFKKCLSLNAAVFPNETILAGRNLFDLVFGVSTNQNHFFPYQYKVWTSSRNVLRIPCDMLPALSKSANAELAGNVLYHNNDQTLCLFSRARKHDSTTMVTVLFATKALVGWEPQDVSNPLRIMALLIVQVRTNATTATVSRPKV